MIAALWTFHMSFRVMVLKNHTSFCTLELSLKKILDAMETHIPSRELLRIGFQNSNSGKWIPFELSSGALDQLAHRPTLALSLILSVVASKSLPKLEIRKNFPIDLLHRARLSLVEMLGFHSEKKFSPFFIPCDMFPFF